MVWAPACCTSVNYLENTAAGRHTVAVESDCLALCLQKNLNKKIDSLKSRSAEASGA